VTAANYIHVASILDTPFPNHPRIAPRPDHAFVGRGAHGIQDLVFGKVNHPMGGYTVHPLIDDKAEGSLERGIHVLVVHVKDLVGSGICQLILSDERLHGPE
jgi:hypothetical protein